MEHENEKKAVGRPQVDYTPYLNEGETMDTVKRNTLKKRKHDREAGIGMLAAEKARLNQGKATGADSDAQLFADLGSLEVHAQEAYPQVADRDRALWLVEVGGTLLRAFNWHKSASQHIGNTREERSEIIDKDQTKSYADQRFYPFFADKSIANEVLGTAHSLTLTPTLSGFLVRVIGGYLAWIETQNTFDAEFEDTQAIKDAVGV